MVESFGFFPENGQHFDYGGWTFTVLSMDGRRVEKVLAERQTEEKPEA